MKLAVALFCSLAASAQQIPDGPGRAELEKMCKGCHELARSVSPRQDRDGWNQTLTKMTAFGMKSTPQDHALVLEYLVRSFPPDEVPKVNVNKAGAIELESRLSLRRSQSAAILAWRAKNGDFKAFEDLEKVPGLDLEKLRARKDRIVFR